MKPNFLFRFNCIWVLSEPPEINIELKKGHATLLNKLTKDIMKKLKGY